MKHVDTTFCTTAYDETGKILYTVPVTSLPNGRRVEDTLLLRTEVFYVETIKVESVSFKSKVIKVKAV